MELQEKLKRKSLDRFSSCSNRVRRRDRANLGTLVEVAPGLESLLYGWPSRAIGIINKHRSSHVIFIVTIDTLQQRFPQAKWSIQPPKAVTFPLSCKRAFSKVMNDEI